MCDGTPVKCGGELNTSMRVEVCSQQGACTSLSHFSVASRNAAGSEEETRISLPTSFEPIPTTAAPEKRMGQGDKWIDKIGLNESIH